MSKLNKYSSRLYQVDDVEVEITNSNKNQITNTDNNYTIIKSIFIWYYIYPKFKEFINSLNIEEMLAFSCLLLNGLILNQTIPIFLTLYGYSLINTF